MLIEAKTPVPTKKKREKKSQNAQSSEGCGKCNKE
jgi:hypothetical protein